MHLKKILYVAVLSLLCACGTKRLAVKAGNENTATTHTTTQSEGANTSAPLATVTPPLINFPDTTPPALPASLTGLLVLNEIVGGGRTYGPAYREGGNDCLTGMGCDAYGNAVIDPLTGDGSCPTWADPIYTSEGPRNGPEYFVCLASRAVQAPPPTAFIANTVSLCGGFRAMGKFNPINPDSVAIGAAPAYDHQNCVLPGPDNTCNRWDFGGCTVVTNAQQGDADCARGLMKFRWSDNFTYFGCAKVGAQFVTKSRLFPGNVGDICGGSMDRFRRFWGCADRGSCPVGTQLVPTSERPSNQFVCVVRE